MSDSYPEDVCGLWTNGPTPQDMISDLSRKKKKDENPLLEALASLEHEQWMTWAQRIMDSEPISQERRDRWAKFMVPYAQLDEDAKNQDRQWARRALNIMAHFQVQ